MLFLYPFLTILLSQRAVSAPAPAPAAPGPLPLADHLDLRHLVHGISTYVKRLVGVTPRDQDYGSYGGYGKYGSYGSYADIGGSNVISEGDSNVNDEPQAEALETMTTRMSVLTTTVTLRSIATPSPTITAVSTASEPMSTRTYYQGVKSLEDFTLLSLQYLAVVGYSGLVSID